VTLPRKRKLTKRQRSELARRAGRAGVGDCKRRPPSHYAKMRALSLEACSPLHPDDVIMIHEHRKQGLTLKAIGALYGLGESAVCRIVNGSRWKDVRPEESK
jgi:hypothetical protein